MKRIKFRHDRWSLLIAAVIAASPLSSSNANPLPMPAPPSAFLLKLTAEAVIVKIDSSESRIMGNYTFSITSESPEPGRHPANVIPPSNPWEPSDLATIGIPVILPYTYLPNGSSDFARQEQDLLAKAQPKATSNGKDYPPELVPAWAEYPQMEAQLPEGWKLALFQFRGLPIDKAKKELQVRISYNQPHLPGKTAAYLPILPPRIHKKNYLITFQSENGTRFTPDGKYNFVGQPSETNLSVRPVNLQLLKMRVSP